jgi:hypothetical protein
LSEKTGNKRTIHILFIDDDKDDAELVDLNLKRTKEVFAAGVDYYIRKKKNIAHFET